MAILASGEDRGGCGVLMLQMWHFKTVLVMRPKKKKRQRTFTEEKGSGEGGGEQKGKCEKARCGVVLMIVVESFVLLIR